MHFIAVNHCLDLCTAFVRQHVTVQLNHRCTAVSFIVMNSFIRIVGYKMLHNDEDMDIAFFKFS